MKLRRFRSAPKPFPVQPLAFNRAPGTLGPMDPFSNLGELSQAVGGVTAIGLVVWLVKRTFSHTIPRLSADFKEALTEQASVFRDEIKQQRVDFREELRLHREELRDQLSRLTLQVQALGDTISILREEIVLGERRRPRSGSARRDDEG